MTQASEDIQSFHNDGKRKEQLSVTSISKPPSLNYMENSKKDQGVDAMTSVLLTPHLQAAKLEVRF